MWEGPPIIKSESMNLILPQAAAAAAVDNDDDGTYVTMHMLYCQDKKVMNLVEILDTLLIGGCACLNNV